MYGTIAHLHVKPGEEQSVIDLMDEWKRERKAAADGFSNGYLYREDGNPRTFILIAAFKDRQTYRANADHPDQDRWFKQVRSHLVDDPVWEDGDIVTTF